MLILILGLVMILVPHSLVIVAPQWRESLMNRYGGLYAGVYSVVSVLGLVLLVWGYSQTRLDPVFIWHPPLAMRHITTLLMLLSFILLAAAYVPHNHFKARLGHPMVLSVKVWALAHLLANGRLGDIVLFTAFLVWAAALFSKLRKQDRAGDAIPTQARVAATIGAVIAGAVGWLVFAMWLHLWLIGVSPV